MVAGNAAFALMWGVGGIAMPPLSGAAMDLLGARGLPLMLGLVCLMLAAASAVSLLRGRR
jgi:fucose permease